MKYNKVQKVNHHNPKGKALLMETIGESQTETPSIILQPIDLGIEP